MIPCGQRSGTDAQVREEVYGGRGEESVKVQGKAAMSEMKWARQQWGKRQKQKQKTVVCHGGFGGDQGARAGRTGPTFVRVHLLRLLANRRSDGSDESTSQPVNQSSARPAFPHRIPANAPTQHVLGSFPRDTPISRAFQVPDPIRRPPGERACGVLGRGRCEARKEASRSVWRNLCPAPEARLRCVGKSDSVPASALIRLLLLATLVLNLPAPEQRTKPGKR